MLSQEGDGPVQGNAIKAAKTEQGSSGGIPVAVAIPAMGDAESAAAAGADGVLLSISSLTKDSAADQVQYRTCEWV